MPNPESSIPHNIPIKWFTNVSENPSNPINPANPEDMHGHRKLPPKSDSSNLIEGIDLNTSIQPAFTETAPLLHYTAEYYQNQLFSNVFDHLNHPSPPPAAAATLYEIMPRDDFLKEQQRPTITTSVEPAPVKKRVLEKDSDEYIRIKEEIKNFHNNTKKSRKPEYRKKKMDFLNDQNINITIRQFKRISAEISKEKRR
jgi:hypothetical protein